MDPAPFLRGNAFGGIEKVPYPRANPADASRLPLDTWMQAQIPVAVRLELNGDARAVEIAYRTTTDRLGYRGAGAGTSFVRWRYEQGFVSEPAALGEGKVRLTLGEPTDHRAVIYLPEGMKPVILDVSPDGGSIEPAGARKRWICYGDSIAEGWCASGPATAWPAIVAREHALDLVNMGYAGAARGEIVSAEHIAELDADVISITHGTNCWKRIPHSFAQFRANLHAFLDVVRQGHPATPIVVASPIVRPDAEDTPNRLGAKLRDLRAAMEAVALERGDANLRLVPGGELVRIDMLGDGIHPDDDGHRALADALGPVLAEAASG